MIEKTIPYAWGWKSEKSGRTGKCWSKPNLGDGYLEFPLYAIDPESIPKWQPIETAPMDGTHILAVLPDRDTCYVICWADARKGIRKELGIDIGWHIAYDGDFLHKWDQPTHWMPLPKMPK